MPTYYARVFEKGQAYGGPEEGGWYYDTGTPIPGHELEKTFTSRSEGIDYLNNVAGPILDAQNRAEGRLPPYRVNSRGDYLCIWLQETPNPPAFPTEIPRYE